MKKILLLTVTASAAIATYFVLRNCACSNQDDQPRNQVKRERHLTTAFSNAKQQAVNEE